MKKAVFILGFALAAAGLFATGAQEDPIEKYRDKVKLTGTLQFNDGFAEIAAGGKSYGLMVPGFMRAVRTLKPGLSIAVEGYKVQPGPRMLEAKAKSEVVFVEKVAIEGKEYDLRRYGAYGCGPAGMGPGRGPGAGRDDFRGFGPGRGSAGPRDGRPYGGMMGGRGGMMDYDPDFEDSGDFPFFGPESE